MLNNRIGLNLNSAKLTAKKQDSKDNSKNISFGVKSEPPTFREIAQRALNLGRPVDTRRLENAERQARHELLQMPTEDFQRVMDDPCGADAISSLTGIYASVTPVERWDTQYIKNNGVTSLPVLASTGSEVAADELKHVQKLIKGTSLSLPKALADIDKGKERLDQFIAEQQANGTSSNGFLDSYIQQHSTNTPDAYDNYLADLRELRIELEANAEKARLELEKSRRNPN